MAVDIYLERSGSKLIPISQQDEEYLKEFLKEGEKVKARLSKPRGVGFHRWYWAMVQIVAENHEVYNTPRKLHLYLKLSTGQIEDLLINPKTGETVYHLKSTSFASMDAIGFRQYVEAALDVIQELWSGDLASRADLIGQTNKRSAENYKELIYVPKSPPIAPAHR